MGLFKSIGKFVGGVGDVVKKVSPLASFIPGVGPLAAAGLGAVGGLAGKLNDKNVTLGNTLGSMAGGAALGGVGGYGIDKLQGLSAANGGGIAGAARGLFGGGGGAASNIATAAAGNAAGGGGLLQQALNFAKNNPELLLGGAGLVSGALGQHSADKTRNEALALARSQQDQRAPLFAALLARMNNPTRPVSLSYRDPNNPFAG